MDNYANEVITKLITLLNHNEDNSLLEAMKKDISEINLKSSYLKSSNLSLTELHVISCIGSHKNINATDISFNVSISKGGVSKITNRLIQRGLIEFHFKKGNKKEKLYQLTQSGTEVFTLHEQLHQKSVNKLIKLLDSFSKEELQTIEQFIDALLDTI